MNIINELKWRGMIKDISDSDFENKLTQKDKTIYCGFDPTASSLHIGNLIQLFTLKRFADSGFKIISVIGGATGRIGDPSFKKDERPLLSEITLDNNTISIVKQIKKIIPLTKVVNNFEWYKNFNFLNFLRDVGKHFNISYLIHKEHISNRLKTGISFTEFSYILLQSYDFYYLYKNYNTHLQLGGSDQWGNIVSGIQFIKNKEAKDSKVFGLTIPLLLQSNGMKFGKTETGTIWLSSEKTTPYLFYQFFYNQSDDQVEKLLKYFTFLSELEVKELVASHNKNKKNHLAQKKLAYEVTRIVHSKQEADDIVIISNVLFKNDINQLNSALFIKLSKIIETHYIANNSVLIDNLIKLKINPSKREANEFLIQNAIKINGTIVNAKEFNFNKEIALFNKFFLLKKGKKKYFLLIIQ